MPSNTFTVYVRQVGIRCPKCGTLLTTDRQFAQSEIVKCTALAVLNEKREIGPCDFIGEVDYPVGVNFVL
jgi:hypothetical protein